MTKIVEIAVCMHDQTAATVLAAQFLTMDFEVKLHYCQSLTELSDCLSKHQINCFIFDTVSTQYKTTEVVRKLRLSHRFAHSSFIFIGDKEKDLSSFQFFNTKTDIMISAPFVKEDYAFFLTEVWNKQLNRFIPENFSILILDNNPDVLEVLGMHMQELNHKNYVTCKTVKEAKSKIQEQDFDLLLLDWDLEDGTCMEIIHMTRSTASSKRLNEALTIVITGRNDVEDIMTLVDMNVKDHIIKPFDYVEFEDKIYYALEKHQKRVG